MPRPEHPYLRSLFDPLMQEARQEIHLTMQVALLIQNDVPRARIAEQLQISPADVRAAIQRLKRISPQIERDADDLVS